MSKYRNRKTNGYDSVKESKRAWELEMMQRAGIIEGLKTQFTWEVIPAQYEGKKCVERSCKYIADFVYFQDGQLVVEDCKGFRTPDYRIKRKLMLKVHGIRIKET